MKTWDTTKGFDTIMYTATSSTTAFVSVFALALVAVLYLLPG